MMMAGGGWGNAPTMKLQANAHRHITAVTLIHSGIAAIGRL